MDASLLTVAIAAGVGLVAIVGVIGLYARVLVRAEQGHALVVSKPGGVDVRFGSVVVLPIVHRAEVIDLRTKMLVIDRRGKRGVSCRDGIRADVVLTAQLRVSPTADDVIKVAQPRRGNEGYVAPERVGERRARAGQCAPFLGRSGFSPATNSFHVLGG